jgi:hypothetical protein
MVSSVEKWFDSKKICLARNSGVEQLPAFLFPLRPPWGDFPIFDETTGENTSS